MKRREFIVEELQTCFEHGPVAWVCCALQILKHSHTGMLQTFPFVLDVELLKVCTGGCRGGGTPLLA